MEKKLSMDINLNFHKDEILPLLIHNGAWKTTIICMLTEMYDVTKGKLL